MTPVITEPFARIDGLPVAIGIVPDVLGMQAWFKEETGYDLIVYSGIRTYAEQEAIFRERYTLTPGGRRVYDARWWNGRLWYRISAAGTVAAPGSSNHETGRSVDLRDSGPDAGVAASFTSARNQLLSANCHRWGFTHTGRNFGEPWHFEQLAIADPFLGRGKPHRISPSNPGAPIGAVTGNPTGGGSTTGGSTAAIEGIDDMAKADHVFYRGPGGRVMIVAGGRSIDLNEKDAKNLIAIQRKNHEKHPRHFVPMGTFGNTKAYTSLNQEQWNVLRAVYPPRG